MKKFLVALITFSSFVAGAALALQLGDTPTLPAALTDSFGKSQPLEKSAFRVFFFYPAASSSGCTTQNIEYTKRYAEFISAKAQVFGVSSDDAKEQCAFIEAQKLKVPQIPDQKTCSVEFLRSARFCGITRGTRLSSPRMGRLSACGAASTQSRTPAKFYAS